jgi:phosphate transport system substrate-binding protein
LKVGGVEATVDNIKNGAYGISRPLSIVYNESVLDNAVNAAFLTFLRCSYDVQRIISDSGYISLLDTVPPDFVFPPSLSGNIDISGSTSLQPLMIKLAAAFEKLQRGVKITVSGGGTGTGYKSVNEGVSVFGMISEEFNSEKAPGCTYHIVAKDGIAVIVNKANPLDDITLEQLKNIYSAENRSALKWSYLIKESTADSAAQ